MLKAETLASISEYGEDSRASSITGLSASTYGIGYTRSHSGDSLNTLTTTATNRSYKNGLHGDRKSNNESAASQRRRKNMAQKRNYELCKKVRVSMALFGILLLVAAIFMLSFYLPKQYEKNTNIPVVPTARIKRVIWDDNLEIKTDMLLLFSTNFSKPVLESEFGPDIALKGYLGEFLSNVSKKEFYKNVNKNNQSISMRFSGEDSHTSLEISKVDFHEQCYEVHWTAKYETILQDCFDTQDVHWFGLGETFSQLWPMDKGSFDMSPFITNDYLTTTKGFNNFGGVIEPFAINSKGAGIYISDSVPLHISMNENDQKKFCIRADSRTCDLVYSNKKNGTNELNYTICIADDIKKVHKIMFDQYIDIPMGIPDKRMFAEPIWSTWVIFKKDINQSLILQFAENIKKYGFSASHIVIDDKYSTEYGDFNFDSKKFSDVSYLINRLRSDGFRTVVWVPPFTNLASKFFLEGIDNWIKVGSPELDKLQPGIVKWWNGVGCVLDTTSKKSIEWFVKRLQKFKKLNLDGFKFDGGEVNSLPPHYVFERAQTNPSYYSTYYVKMAYQFPLSEVRVGYKSQKYPVFVRFLDRRSNWDSQGGLRSVLSAALTFSILGYSYMIPDMVGGNNYINVPNKELYVRWVQLCIFFPSIQFSFPPWTFSDEVVSIVHEALAIRQNLTSYIYELAETVNKTGEPILRPLWWYWPKDRETFVVDAEFMLGDRYLIAPVLNPNIMQLAIYLPPGIWEEQWGRREVLNNTEGKFHHYKVELRTICYFKLLELLPGKY